MYFKVTGPIKRTMCGGQALEIQTSKYYFGELSPSERSLQMTSSIGFFFPQVTDVKNLDLLRLG